MKDKNKNHGFIAPEGYFESFDERMFEKLSEGKLPKEAGFTAPPGYFESIEEKVMARIKEEPTTKVIRLFGKRTLLYAASIAACAVLVFSLINSEEKANIDIDDLQLASIETYIADGNLGLNSFDVLALIADEDLTTIDIENEFLSEENLHEYLLENLDDTTLLIE